MRDRFAVCCLLALGLGLSAPHVAHATMTFKQLDDGVFVVSHRVKIIGGRGQAMEMAYTKAASLCIAAGYRHFEILQQESEADDAANASVRVRFSIDGGGDRIDCERNADPKYIQQAGKKLAKQGYEAPSRNGGTEPAAETTEADGAGTDPRSCTIEQIAAMARTGLSDEKIRAACDGDE